jgi:integrase
MPNISYLSSTRWLAPKKVREKYSISDKELRRLREERAVTYRPYGNKFLYSEDSLDALFAEGKVLAEPRVKIVEKVIPIQAKGGGSTEEKQGLEKAKMATKSPQGGQKMRWVKGLRKDGQPNGQFRLNCGDFTVFEYQENGKFFYYIDYRDSDGVRHTNSLKKIAGRPVNNRSDAYEVARKFRNEMYEEQAAKDDPDITFSEYAPIFLEKKRADRTIRYYKGIEYLVNRLATWWGDLSLREISQKTAEKYRDHRRKTIEDYTIDMELGYLNQVLKQAEKDGIKTRLIDRNDLGLESPQRYQEFMSEEMEEIIWPLLRKYPPMEDLAMFILDSSMRPINMIQLKWSDIRWNEKPVPIAFVPGEIHKNRKDGEYLLSDRVIKMLRRRQSENGQSDLVFVRYEGQRPWPITHCWYQRRWNEVKEEANKILEKRVSDLRIPKKLRFYDLKATCLSRAGASEFQLQAISNHTNTASLQRYVRRKALQSSAREFLNGNGKTA